MQVNFGEAGGRVGTSACRVPDFGLSTAPVQLRLPYKFRRSGRHRVAIDVLSGRCAGAVGQTRKTIEVKVAARRGKPPARPASGCANGTLIPTAVPAVRARVSAAVLCLVNVQRRKNKRANLRRSPRLALVAIAHSKDMVRRRYFSHVSPTGGTLPSRLRKRGYRGVSAAENIAFNEFETADSLVRAWMNSPPHRKNILERKYRFAGVGIARGIPFPPQLPGSTSTMHYGSSLR